MTDTLHNHLSAERMQAFLDGELPTAALAAAEEHLDVCPRCSAELEAWQELFRDLGGLSAHRPHEGFADRVMTEVEVPEARPLAARLRDRVAAALSAHEDSHVPGHVLQDFLDGALATRRAERLEAHLDGCSDCASEADAWLGVMTRLDDLGSFAPAEGFAERVLSDVEMPERMPLAARLRAAVDSIFGSPAPEHAPAGILQDFVDGMLPPTAVARVEGHVEECGRCADEVRAWSRVAARLGSLGHLEPAEGFAERVMLGLQEARAAAVARTPAVSRPAAAWSRLLTAARTSLQRFLPETRQAVAALSGAAVTPMVVLGLAVWSLWSHPTLTLGSLASFAWWQLTDLTASAAGALSGVMTGSAEVFGLYSLVESLASAPALVAGGVVAYTMICALALRVLYRNLFTNRSPGGRRPHASTAS